MGDATSTTIAWGVLIVLLVIYLAVIVFLIATFWRVFAKAGQPGWAAIIPIYNVYVLCKVAGRPGWWFVLFLIPAVNIVIAIIVALDVAKAFGKGGAFGFFGLFLFSFIGYPILAFGRARYQGAGGAGRPGPDVGYPPPLGSYPPPGGYRGN